MAFSWFPQQTQFRWTLLGFQDKLNAEQKVSLDRLKLKLADACILWNKYYSGKFTVVLLASPIQKANLEITYDVEPNNLNISNKNALLQKALAKTHEALIVTSDEIRILSLSAIRVLSSSDNLLAQAYSPGSSNLMLEPTIPEWDFADIDLPEQTLQDLKRVVILIKNKSKIYDEWNLKKIYPNPKVLVNLCGPPGTGKTMSVHGIASELEMSILELNYSQIESKYMGEGPKNLHRIFDLAKSKSKETIIFFDEADALLSKKVANVEQSADQAINAMRSQMLFEIDHFDGIAIFATNFKDIYDRGFLSRMMSIEFSIPDSVTRECLLRRFLVDGLPGAKDVDIVTLAEISEGLSGRDIRDAVLSAAADIILQEHKSTLEHSLIKMLKQLAETRVARIKKTS